MRAAISQVAAERKEADFLLASWWETLSIQLVENLKLFTSGNGGRGHGGPLEMSSAAVFLPNSVEAGRGPDLPPRIGRATVRLRRRIFQRPFPRPLPQPKRGSRAAV